MHKQHTQCKHQLVCLHTAKLETVFGPTDGHYCATSKSLPPAMHELETHVLRDSL